MSIEGAMLGGYLLPEKEFKTLMKQLLDQNKGQFYGYINSTILYAKSNDIKSAYYTWSKFQTEVFKNPVTSILAITNFHNRKSSQTWNFFDDEISTIQTDGRINIAKADTDLKRAYNSNILAAHLSEMFKTISGTKMEPREIHFLFAIKKRDDLHSLAEKKRILKTLNEFKQKHEKATYKEAIYRGLKNFGYRGKVADAFLNHIGARHWDAFNRFANGDSSAVDQIAKHSVREEEMSHGYYNFTKRLLDSLNRTGWQTGGDLIVTDKSGKVIANIQLKTSAKGGEAIGRINTAQLVKDLEIIEQKMIKNDETIVNNFWELLKTSTATEGLGDAVINEGYELAKLSLGVK